jgi:hypothetical protein
MATRWRALAGRWRVIRGRVSTLAVMAVLVTCAALGALMFAFLGPEGRADAVAGAMAAIAATSAALAAIYLSKEALARTDQQLADAWRATMLSRYPLLLPIHQSVSFPASAGVIDVHPPTQDRFRMDSPHQGSYAFVAGTPDALIIPVENAGEGPALRIMGTLWRNDGAAGEIDGPSALGAGRIAIMTARLGLAGQVMPQEFGGAIRSAGDRPGTVYYWLDLSYIDVFGNMLSACALFDPTGLGAWRHTHGPKIEPFA